MRRAEHHQGIPPIIPHRHCPLELRTATPPSRSPTVYRSSRDSKAQSDRTPVHSATRTTVPVANGLSLRIKQSPYAGAQRTETPRRSRLSWLPNRRGVDAGHAAGAIAENRRTHGIVISVVRLLRRKHFGLDRPTDRPSRAMDDGPPPTTRRITGSTPRRSAPLTFSYRRGGWRWTDTGPAVRFSVLAFNLSTGGLWWVEGVPQTRAVLLVA